MLTYIICSAIYFILNIGLMLYAILTWDSDDEYSFKNLTTSQKATTILLVLFSWIPLLLFSLIISQIEINKK